MARTKPPLDWFHAVQDPRLWRNDLEDLQRILNEAAASWHAEADDLFREKWGDRTPSIAPPERRQVTIEDEHVEYESLDEARSLIGNNPAHLALKLRDESPTRGISIEIRRDKATVYAWGHESIADVFQSVRDTLIRSQQGRWPAMLVGVGGASVLSFLAIFAGMAAYEATGSALSAAPFYVMSPIAGLLSPYLGALRKRGAWLIPRDDGRGFWHRNWDKIAIGAIMAFVGMLTKTLFDLIAPSLQTLLP